MPCSIDALLSMPSSARRRFRPLLLAYIHACTGHSSPEPHDALLHMRRYLQHVGLPNGQQRLYTSDTVPQLTVGSSSGAADGTAVQQASLHMIAAHVVKFRWADAGALYGLMLERLVLDAGASAFGLVRHSVCGDVNHRRGTMLHWQAQPLEFAYQCKFAL
jgi:hypothetical protein